MICLGKEERSVIFEITPKYCISDSFVDYDGYSISSKGILPTVGSSELNAAILVHFSSLIIKMSMFTISTKSLQLYLTLCDPMDL